jgi:hypothetical protein
MSKFSVIARCGSLRSAAGELHHVAGFRADRDSQSGTVQRSAT